MNRRKAVFLDFQGTFGGDRLGHILDFAFFPFAAPARLEKWRFVLTQKKKFYKMQCLEFMK